MDSQAPVTPEQISPTWLTETFKTAGLDFGRVTGADVEVFPDGLSLTGKLARIRLRYEDPGSGPASMIAKMPDPEQVNAIIRSAYQREVAFYREIGRDSGVRVPMMYHGSANDQSAIILLEDLSPIEPGDSTTGCSLDEAIAATKTLAAMHARWWQSPRISNAEWIWRPGTGMDLDEIAAQQDEGWSLAPSEFRDALPDSAKAMVSQKLWYSRIIRLIDQRPKTLTHPDFRLDNMFFDHRRTPIEVTVIDWGRVTFASIGQSLAFLLARETGLDAPDLEECLNIYQQELVKEGIADYSPEDCRLDFRLGVLQVLAQSLWQFWSGPNIPLDERILEMRRQGWERVNRVLVDFDCMSVDRS